MNTPLQNFLIALNYCRFLIALIFSSLVFYSSSISADPEKSLLQALDAIQSSNIEKAEQVLKSIISDVPEFKLAHMVYADLLTARSSYLSHAGMGMRDKAKLGELIDEVRLRYEARQEFIIDDGKIPAVLAQLDSTNIYAIVIDLKQSRLYVFENHDGQFKRITDYYISMGRGGSEKKKEGDLKTPLGVYFIESFIPPDMLSDKYGAGAYPINYPNELDKINGLTGSGIWLHGTPSGTYNRPPLASEGCVVLPNDNLRKISSYISLGKTPVIIGNNIEWLTPEQWQGSNRQTSERFEQWIKSWESADVDEYLKHYSKSFNNGNQDYRRWAAHKRRVAKNKQHIKVSATNVSHLKHPNKNIMVSTFHQRYVSNNFSGQSWKRQYWQKESDGEWRIIYENEIDWPDTTRLAKLSN